jgi:hypothetical protein
MNDLQYLESCGFVRVSSRRPVYQKGSYVIEQNTGLRSTGILKWKAFYYSFEYTVYGHTAKEALDNLYEFLNNKLLTLEAQKEDIESRIKALKYKDVLFVKPSDVEPQE